MINLIDHTALRPDTTDADVRRLCEEASHWGFAAVCVMPYYLPLAGRYLEELESSVALCAPIGFPNGLHQSRLKAYEASKAIDDGARELDMVMNIGALKSGHLRVVVADIARVAEVTRTSGAVLKVILETSLLSDEEKRTGCMLAVEGGADIVKTSTGFAGGGATTEDIQLLRSLVPTHIGVKASGGIRDLQTARAMIEAGATRLGTSAGVAIAEAARAEESVA